MNKRLIIKFILFAITLLPSLKSGAQNVFFGDTLRFDSIVIIRLFCQIKRRKNLNCFLIEKNYFQKIHRLLCFYGLEIKLLRIVNYWR